MSWTIKESTEVIESKIKPYIELLRETRSVVEFSRWRKNSVENAFRVGDFVKKLMSKSDNLQVIAVAGTIKSAVALPILDDLELGEYGELVLRQPAIAILMAIMGSPLLLPCVNHGLEVITECIRQCNSSVGRDDTVQALAKVCTAGITAKAERNCLLTNLNRISSPDSGATPIFSHVELSLGTDLLLAIHAKSTTPMRVDSDALQTLEAAVKDDDHTLAVLIAALTMPFTQLAELLSAREHVHRGISQEEQQAATGRARATHMLEHINAIYRLSRADSLWDILKRIAREAPWRLVLPFDGGYLEPLTRTSPATAAVLAQKLSRDLERVIPSRAGSEREEDTAAAIAVFSARQASRLHDFLAHHVDSTGDGNDGDDDTGGNRERAVDIRLALQFIAAKLM